MIVYPEVSLIAIIVIAVLMNVVVIVVYDLPHSVPRLAPAVRRTLKYRIEK
jgi:hypothetical protein